MFKTSDNTAIDTGFARGFLETTRAYLADDALAVPVPVEQVHVARPAPLPVLERGAVPRRMLHILGPDAD